MSSKIKVDTIENVAGSGNVSLGSGHNLVVPGNITGQGTLAVTGDATFDTTTLKVDASADKVGINTTAMDASLEVNSASSKINTLTVKTAAGSGGVAGIGFMAGQTTAGREKAAMFFKETNGGAHYTGDIVFAVASSSGNATQVAASDEVFRVRPTGIAIGGTGDANTFDDYEEGTWTATLEGSSSNPSSSVTTTGMYTKIGRQVTLNFKFTNVNTTGAGGGIRVSGMPFAPSDTDPTSIGSNVAVANGIMLYSRWTGAGHLTNYMTTGYIAVYRSTSTSAWAEAAHSAGAGFYYWATVVYMTNT